MSEEEKKSIELLKLTIKDNRKLFQENGIYKYFNEDKMKATEIILNLIERQQKEIEERNTRLQEEIKENHKMVIEILELKETIEKLENDKRGMLIELYKANDKKDKLKEENASLQKEIKLMKSININDNYVSKDKIRDKIKEYQNKLFQDIEENKVVEYENIIQVLEELLEENNKCK